MQRKLAAGEIFKLRVAYEDDASKSKWRPVIVLDASDVHQVVIVATTSVPPNDPPGYYDEFKYPLKYWRYAKLHKESWVKVANPLMVDGRALTGYIGELHQDDLLGLITYLNEMED